MPTTKPFRARLLSLGAVAFAAASGCGGGSAGGSGAVTTGWTGADGGAAGLFQPAPHPALPRVISLGGPVLTAPKVLPIVYPGDTGAAGVQAFLGELGQSGVWGQVTAEYGVGPLTVLPAVTMTTAAPGTIADGALQSVLAANTTGVNPPWGAADPQTIYLFLLPRGTIEQDGDGVCCTDFDGYHAQARAGSAAVPYAVTCACPGFDGAGITLAQARTIAVSHELYEAATDPLPFTNPAYAQEDADDAVWTLVTDGEVADMCELNDDANVVPVGSTDMVQRSWSNAAAARGDNPCVPSVTTAPYLNSFPALVSITDDAVAAGFTTKGLRIPIGQKKTIALTLVSAAPTDKTWAVKVYDSDTAISASATPGLALSLDKSAGRNGDVIHLTVTPSRANATLGGEAFVIVSDYGAPGDPDFESQLAMGLVTN
ncbi:MAG TPA: hypothetical protein VHH90_00925 [Polyangia bacterium]|nr:hypothetical protein [Polyangia bacterium]